MSNRPFEVGDLIISKRYGNGFGVVVSISDSEKSGKAVFDGTDYEKVFLTETGIFKYFDLEKIKTIRRPRKGNAESRAIVAMLARNVHKKALQLHSYTKHEVQFKKIYNVLRECDSGLYVKAKSMLK